MSAEGNRPLLAVRGCGADHLRHGRRRGGQSYPAIPVQSETFAPNQIALLDGPFKHAMELDAKWPLSLEPDRLLSRYRQEAGLTPKAKSYIRVVGETTCAGMGTSNDGVQSR